MLWKEFGSFILRLADRQQKRCCHGSFFIRTCACVIASALVIVGLSSIMIDGAPRRRFSRTTVDTQKSLTDGAGTFPKNGFYKQHDDVDLDYFIAGFPKCGTTSLHVALQAHNETVLPDGEVSVMTLPGSDEEIYRKLMEQLTPLAPNSRTVKRGIKCPSGLGTLRAVERLERLFPDTKLIFGLRHPVILFQSFFNYRVMNHHHGKSFVRGTIPSVESLINETWASVSVEVTRFETTLKNLGKTANTTTEDGRASTPFKVFMYDVEQMEDHNLLRRESFRHSLKSFLELEQSIPFLPHKNKVEEVFDETINICDSRYDNVRNVLVDNGKATQKWILEEFLPSPDVTVGNERHFVELVQAFGSDPCLESTP